MAFHCFGFHTKAGQLVHHVLPRLLAPGGEVLAVGEEGEEHFLDGLPEQVQVGPAHFIEEQGGGVVVLLDGEQPCLEDTADLLAELACNVPALGQDHVLPTLFDPHLGHMSVFLFTVFEKVFQTLLVFIIFKTFE